MQGKLLIVGVVAFAAAACTKTVVLKEDRPVRVTARAPEPPPPPPPPKRVEVKKEKIQVNEKIHFEFNRAEIRSESFGLLDEIAGVISEHPEVVKIRIEGHTDNVGSHKYNLDLSKRRAKAVYDYLVNKGIEEARLSTEGYSFDQPIADNETDEGRAKNRRVEFTILERSGETPPAEETAEEEAAPDAEESADETAEKEAPAEEAGDASDEEADEEAGDQGGGQ